MKKIQHLITTTIFICLTVSPIFAQQDQLFSFEIYTGIYDSISVSFDENISNESTGHFIGTHNAEITDLDLGIPTTNLWPDAQYTKKEKANDNFDLYSFPIRTTIRTFLTFGDSIAGNCSGSMISSRHVIIAKHCFVKFTTDTLMNFDSIYVCPIYNNGKRDVCFDCAYVKKIFFFDELGSIGNDIAVLELNRGIGRNTGWIGIGFNEQDAFYEDKVFHKFSYPAVSSPFDPFPYNGDTLYHSYGLLDRVLPRQLGVDGVFASVGESGSSLIYVDQEEEVYTSFGVLSTGTFRHTRITNKVFYSIKEIIEDQTAQPTNSDRNISDFSLGPNPTSGYFSIRGINDRENAQVIIHDASGREVFPLTDLVKCGEIDLSHLASGVYFVSVMRGEEVETKKLVLYIG